VVGGEVALGDLECLLFETTVSQISELEFVGEVLFEEPLLFLFILDNINIQNIYDGCVVSFRAKTRL